MFEGLFQNITEAEKNDAIEGIISHATPRLDFFLMLVLSVSMASFGILLNSTIILIASMLIAPLLYPLIAFALGIIVTDVKLIGGSLYTFGKSIFLALIASFLIGFLFSSANDGAVLSFSSLSSNTSFPMMYAVVAAIAGFAAAFAMTKPHLNDTLPGVAIAVALVPPLAEAGVALSSFNWAVFSNALLLLSVNFIGIVFSAMIVFALLRFSVKKTVTQEAVKEQEKVIEKEATNA
ncbi:MAG: DUF389 domain-containing protein [Parcubacteria group bacterium]